MDASCEYSKSRIEPICAWMHVVLVIVNDIVMGRNDFAKF
jgi:hypothetical protein